MAGPVDTPFSAQTIPSFIGDVWTDRSGTCTAGASKAVCAANPGRVYLMFQNSSATDKWINFAIAAVGDQPSIKVPPNTVFEWKSPMVPLGALNVICANAESYTCKEG